MNQEPQFPTSKAATTNTERKWPMSARVLIIIGALIEIIPTILRAQGPMFDVLAQYVGGLLPLIILAWILGKIIEKVAHRSFPISFAVSFLIFAIIAMLGGILSLIT